MNKIAILMTFSAALFAAAACGSQQSAGTEKTRMENTQSGQNTQTSQNPQSSSGSPFPRGDQAPPDTFTGTVYVHPLAAKNANNNFSVASVTFQPGARAFWHSHPAGQTILVTAGQGLYQEKGKPVRPLNKGDVVLCDPDIEHWHGASPGSALTHVVITNYKGDSQVNWLRPVTEEEYTAAAK
jgi:quercetin dioxygenase-like cupin family protein